jgi:hypothetical protein
MIVFAERRLDVLGAAPGATFVFSRVGVVASDRASCVIKPHCVISPRATSVAFAPSANRPFDGSVAPKGSWGGAVSRFRPRRSQTASRPRLHPTAMAPHKHPIKQYNIPRLVSPIAKSQFTRKTSGPAPLQPDTPHAEPQAGRSPKSRTPPPLSPNHLNLNDQRQGNRHHARPQ